MNGLFVAILTQALLLFGTSTGFNQPAAANSPDRSEGISTETIRKDLSLKPGGLVLLDTQFGNVTVETYSGREIRVELKLRGTSEGMSDFKFTHNYFGDQLTLKGWYESPAGSLIPDLTQIEFVVLIPKDAPYSVSVLTKQGSINAGIARNMKCVDLSTEAGKVNIAMPSDMSANVDASTSGLGDVSVMPENALSNLLPGYELRSADHVKFRMNGGRCTISAYSGIGNVYFNITSPKIESQS